MPTLVYGNTMVQGPMVRHLVGLDPVHAVLVTAGNEIGLVHFHEMLPELIFKQELHATRCKNRKQSNQI